MFIKGSNENFPKLWKTSEDLLRPLTAKKPYIVEIDPENKTISQITHEENSEKLSTKEKFLHILFFLTIIPPIFLLIARTAYRASYGVDEKMEESTLKISGLFRSRITLASETPGGPNIKLAEAYSFLDNAVNYYKSLVTDPEMQTADAKIFVYFELQRIVNDLNSLEKECANEPELSAAVKKLKTATQILMEIRAPLQDPSLAPATGIKNVGNSCYINSALQPLLAVGHLIDFIPENLVQDPNESDKIFALRNQILEDFRKLIEMRKTLATAKEMGDQVEKLRKECFQAGFPKVGANRSETGMQDAGEFIEFLFETIGCQLKAKTVINKPEPEEQQVIDMTSGCLYLDENRKSIKEMVEAYGLVKARDGGLLGDVQTKILGEPPSLLVLSFSPRTIQLEGDQVIDASKMFENKVSSADATYELVGFCQNQQEVHWTSVVKTAQGWTYCNDASVTIIKPSDRQFRFPCTYAIYRKAQI